MALDFEKVKAASLFDLLSLFVCEFSRGVDALERIAPEPQAEHQATAAPPTCPCPPELRVKCDAVMGEPVSFRCGLCGAPAIQQLEA